MRVALYARVSTDDQDCDLQLKDLRAYVARQGWPAAEEFVDTGFSGAKASRPALDKLLADHKKFDAVIVWKLDRFGRSVINLSQHLSLLDRSGVRFIAITQNIDTDTRNPVSQLIIHIIGAVAEFELETIRERIRAGIKNAKANGMILGRKRRVFRRDEVVEMRKAGKSWGAISKHLGIPISTIRCAYAEITGEGTAVLGARSKQLQGGH